MPIYTHPNIRDQSYKDYMSRLERARAGRLVMALEHEQIKQLKHEALLSRLGTKWGNLSARVDKKLATLEDVLLDIDDMLSKLQTLNNEIKENNG